MKTNMMKMIRQLSLTFSITAFVVGSLCAQEAEKTFVNEINVSEDTKIFVNGPNNFDMEMHGTMSISSEDNKYVIKGKDWKPVVKIEQDFQIYTWKEHKVKQTIIIKVETVEPGKSQELINKLEPRLEENAAGQVYVNSNINIKKFELVNGFFRRDRSTLTLTDGSKYDIKKLEIKASATIPESNDLDIDLRFTKATLGTHTGKINAVVHHSGLKANQINELDVELVFSTLNVKSAKVIHYRSENGTFNLRDVENLKGKSTFSKYLLGNIDHFELNESQADQITIKVVNSLDSKSATFTNFQITTLTKHLLVNAQNGDLFVSNINEGFEKIEVENVFSTINLGVKTAKNYFIEEHKNIFTSYDFPAGLMVMGKTDNGNKSYLMGNKNKAGKIIIKCESCKVFFDY